MLMPASMLACRRLLAYDFLAHSTRICSDNSFFKFLTVSTIPIMPLWMAKGEIWVTDGSLSNDSIIINCGQSAAFRRESELECLQFQSPFFGCVFVFFVG